MTKYIDTKNTGKYAKTRIVNTRVEINWYDDIDLEWIVLMALLFLSWRIIWAPKKNGSIPNTTPIISEKYLLYAP